jgi:serine/threonine protein kinase
MPSPADANDLAQLAVRCGLIEEGTARELLYEFDDPKGSAADFAKLMERKRLLTPFQSGKLLKGESDGYFLGGYRLLYKIASGSFGRVYRGDDPRSGRVVAIKVLRRRHLDTPKRIESFEREGRLGMSLDHPNIVRILNVSKDTTTGSHFIVMDFVEGGNLRDILQIRKTVEVDEALRIMEEAVNGLAYSYARGLTHRDIKPSNILLGTDKIAKLVDFGLAEVTDVPEIMVVGVKSEKDERAERTVDYAGLEKATGVPSGDVRSDIYFLGHVLYEMVAGAPLLPPTKNAHTRMSRRRFEEVEPALEREARSRHLPPPLVRLIAKAIALEPTQRFQTPTAFLDAIKKCRLELTGSDAGTHNSRRAEGPLTIFVAEPNPKLQAVFREKLREYGFSRVLISIDPDQVVKRYAQQPYHACLIDAGALGREGLDAFKRVVREADAQQRDLAAVVLLNDDQRAWVDDAMSAGGGEVIVRPVTMNVLHEVLAEHLPELKKTAAQTNDDTES